MEPQPSSPASLSSSGSAKGTTPFGEMPLPDEATEEAPAGLDEHGRESTSSSSSSSSSSSAGSAFHVDAANLRNATIPVTVETPPLDEPAEEEAPAIEEQGRQSTSSSSPAAANPVHLDAANLGNATIPVAETPPPDEPANEEEVPAVEQGRHSSSSPSSSSDGSAFHIDTAAPAPAPWWEDERQQVADVPVQSAPPAKPDERATLPEEVPRAVDSSPSSDSGGAAVPLPTTTTSAPPVQTMSPELDGGAGFNPDRIPASVFQPRTSSVSQGEWSMASNESLFSIQGVGAQSSADLFAINSSRSHFDYFYDEAMAEQEAAAKLPPLAEGPEVAVPGSAGSSGGSAAGGKKDDAVLRRNESGSGGSSSNFSFAFPMYATFYFLCVRAPRPFAILALLPKRFISCRLAPTSPKKKDCVTASLYQPLRKEYEPPMPQPPVAAASSSAAFVEMTTEEERRRSDGWCCCGCCWFDCSAWSSCCCWCCRRRWCQCGGCSCSCPAVCRCSWCLCF